MTRLQHHKNSFKPLALNSPVFALCLSFCFFQNTWAQSTPHSTSLSLGYYLLNDEKKEKEYFYTVSLKHKYKNWRFKLSQPYVRDSDTNSGLANGTLAIGYLWNFRPIQLEISAKQRLNNADKAVTLPVKDRGVFTSINTLWHRTYLYFDAGYWWREETALKRKSSAQWAIGGFYPIKTGQWLGVGVDQSESVIQQNKDTYLSAYWQAKLNERYKMSIAISKGLTEKSPDYFAGLQLTRRF